MMLNLGSSNLRDSRVTSVQIHALDRDESATSREPEMSPRIHTGVPMKSQAGTVADDAISGPILAKTTLRNPTVPFRQTVAPVPNGKESPKVRESQGPPDRGPNDDDFAKIRPCTGGWLIEWAAGHDRVAGQKRVVDHQRPTDYERPDDHASDRMRGDSDSRMHGERRFLQIGTGQWCGAEYATLFPMRRTAIIYAREFGLLADRCALITPSHELE